MLIGGSIEREGIRASISRVGDQLDDVLGHLDQTESLTRIKDALLPSPTSVIWYDNAEKGPGPRLWSLDDTPTDDERPGPIAQYDGLELSTVRLEEVEKIYTKRHIAENIDGAIRTAKRRRTIDVQPYIGLATHGEHLEELREYMPPGISEGFKHLSTDVQKAALKISHRLGQEYRYAVLHEILRQRANTLQKLSLLEDMERAMLALHTEKFKVSLGFYLEQSIDNVRYLFKLQVNISRYRSLPAGTMNLNADFVIVLDTMFR